ncbi:hypothetical protein BD289DRAFT_275503 [Coniella lustricola]|uniref:Uncharacterized protein n=1 Tax=Coniella lustricola TaxID=2025994 RepID=A0A2T3A6V1_9PEZI|nr:hypothetical protein BD289DRAFT_275503 [Coniella lustricola]
MHHCATCCDLYAEITRSQLLNGQHIKGPSLWASKPLEDTERMPLVPLLLGNVTVETVSHCHVNANISVALLSQCQSCVGQESSLEFAVCALLKKLDETRDVRASSGHSSDGHFKYDAEREMPVLFDQRHGHGDRRRKKKRKTVHVCINNRARFEVLS